MTVGTFEAKTKFSELLDKVEAGEDIIITRRKPVARMTVLDVKEHAIDLDNLRAIADRFVAAFGRPFKSTEIDDLLSDEDGLPR